jgi:hypothetical protein
LKLENLLNATWQNAAGDWLGHGKMWMLHLYFNKEGGLHPLLVPQRT